MPHILDAYSKDGKHGAELWIEMLKQIHAIHARSTDANEEEKEFEDWLASYLKPEVTTPPTRGPEQPAGETEQPAEGAAHTEAEAETVPAE